MDFTDPGNGLHFADDVAVHEVLFPALAVIREHQPWRSFVQTALFVHIADPVLPSPIFHREHVTFDPCSGSYLVPDVSHLRLLVQWLVNVVHGRPQTLSTCKLNGGTVKKYRGATHGVQRNLFSRIFTGLILMFNLNSVTERIAKIFLGFRGWKI